MRRTHLFLAPVWVTLWNVAPAWARETWLLPGPLFSQSFTVHGTGLGAEVSVMHYNTNCLSSTEWGLGGFTQAQWVLDDRARYAAGFQAGPSGAGFELGWALATQEEAKPRYSGPHIGAFLSVGYASTALRVTIPVETDGRELPRIDVGIAISVKVPLSVPEFALPEFSGIPMR